MPAFRMKCRKCGNEFHRHYSIEEFEEHQYKPNGWTCFSCGYPRMAVIRSNKAVKDGFKPGYQRNIGEYCSSYSEYKQKLKDKGLIEIGYEELPHDEDGNVAEYWTDDIIKKVIDMGVDLSGREIEGIKSGEALKD